MKAAEKPDAVMVLEPHGTNRLECMSGSACRRFLGKGEFGRALTGLCVIQDDPGFFIFK